MQPAVTKVGQRVMLPPVFPKPRFRTTVGVELEYLAIPKFRGNDPTLDPNARTLVFFNGFMLRFSQWGFQMPRYTLQHGLNGFSDCNLIFFNNFGHGNSEINGTGTRDYLRHCALAAHELVRSLGIHGRMFTVAHSMGSPISLEFQRLTADQVGGMAFVSPLFSDPMKVFPYAGLVEPRLEQIQALLKHDHVASIVTKALTILAADIPLRIWHAVFTRKTGSKIRQDAFVKNLRKSLELDISVFITALLSMIQTGDEIGSRFGHISVPRKIILGERDFITDQKKTEQIIRELAPDIPLVVLENTTHWANSERPRRVNKELREFVDSVS
ncbi:MAG: alpha/beta hydrolase [Candidatus Micrarchaeota archaeon]